MIDFTDIAKNNLSFRAYGGANGIKKGILIDEEPYMLKIEHRDKKNTEYKNSVLSEYIACKIYSILGIPTQKVILGTITDNNKEKFCVACKDFKGKNEYLYEFISIKNSVLVDNSSNGNGTELKDILKAIQEQKFCKTKDVKNRFWDMFVIDSYLGNFDRHNGNWGFLVNEETGVKKLAPVYDCGSCLFPLADDSLLEKFLNTPSEMEMRVFKFPTSAIKLNDEKINYYDFLTTTKNQDCLKAITRLVPKIQEKSTEIKELINSISVLSPVRKEFYCQILDMRKEKILEPALERANSLVNKWTKTNDTEIEL